MKYIFELCVIYIIRYNNINYGVSLRKLEK